MCHVSQVIPIVSFETLTNAGGLGSIYLSPGITSFMNVRNKQVAPSKLLHTFLKNIDIFQKDDFLSLLPVLFLWLIVIKMSDFLCR